MHSPETIRKGIEILDILPEDVDDIDESPETIEKRKIGDSSSVKKRKLSPNDIEFKRKIHILS